MMIGSGWFGKVYLDEANDMIQMTCYQIVMAYDGVGCTGAPGFGIRLMIERARRVGGRLEIGPRTDGVSGTRLLLDLPVAMR